MNLPVRIVCGGCFKSLDYGPDLLGRMPTDCPSCGGPLNSALSELETPTSGYVPPSHIRELSSMGSGAATGETGPVTDVWGAGSLGKIARFQLREIIGDGGFGRVYKAYDPRLDRDVALKVLKPEAPDERVKQRFFREARAVASLNHPNIVKVHDSGCDGRYYWVAYQLVKGRTLTRLLAEGKRPDFLVTARIIRTLADALRHAHRRSVFHRDLKPSNVVIDENGNPHLIDFGLARRADYDSDLTRDGAVIGTPVYMPPEQAAGRSRIADARSDLYSLGLIFYEMLCGKRAVDLAEDVPAWRKTPGDTTPIPPPRSVIKEVPLVLDQICMKALAPDASRRYPSAKAFRLDLERWIRGKQGRLNISMSLTNIVLGIGAALLLVVGLTAMSGLVHKPETEPVPFLALAPRATDREVAGTADLVDPPTPRPDAEWTSETPRVVTNGAETPALRDSQMVWVFNKSDRFHTTRCSSVRAREKSAQLMTLGEARLQNPRIAECANCKDEARK